MRTKSLQSCTTLCYPMDHSPPVCSVYGFSRQDCWSGLLFPSPRNFPNPGIETASLMFPALAGRFFTTSDTWEIERAAGLKAICGVPSQRAACSGGGIQK